MTGGPIPPTPPGPPTRRAGAGRRAARRSRYAVHVVTHWDDKPRFEVVSRDGGDPYCLISDDPREIWRELRPG